MSKARRENPMGTRLVLVTTLVFALIGVSPLTATAATGDAQVRVIHASPDTPPVDVYVDGAKAIAALGFTKASDYQTIPAGKHNFQLFQAGATPTGSDPVIQVKGVEIATGAKLSVAAIGWLASIRTLVVDDRTPAPAPDKAKLRFVHVGPDVQAVDLATKGGVVLFGSGQFGTAYPYQEVDAQRSDLELRPAGAATGVVTVGFAPEAGKTYSAYLMSLGAMRVLLDTAAGDATPVAAPAVTNSPTNATASTATAPFLGQTGRGASRQPFDFGLLVVALAGAACIGGGIAIRRRARC